MDELQSHIPSIGALRRTTKKIRIEGNPIQEGKILDRTKRATIVLTILLHWIQTK